MSEQLLKAIIHLLAIVAKEDDVTEDERQAIVDFLLENVSKKDVDKFMKLFDQLSEQMAGERKVSFSEEKEIELLAKQVNKELSQQQKIIVLFKVMELIIADGEISEREDILLAAIGEYLNFKEREVKRIKAFVVHKKEQYMSADNILIVTPNKQILAPSKSKHIQRPLIDGMMAFFRIPALELYFVKYVGSQQLNLNGTPLRYNKIYTFSSGSSIRGNAMKSVYYSDIVSTYRETTDQKKISFVAENIQFKFPNGTVGLQNINISEPSGKLIGLMGGSGAGKSTLLNVLNGNDTPNRGFVRINGIDIHKDPESIEGIIGYVPQDDLLIEELTVFENLQYAAKLCFSNLSDIQINDLVEKTLAALGLMATRDLKVGSPLEKTISGGQRKRLNIGLELLREPSVMFVDEPTSGLSSRDSENIMDLLKELSLKGKMIFVVIHQPSSDIFKMFDKLVILDVGGYQIYYGNPVDAVVYFKGLVDLIDKDSGSCIECGNVNSEQIFNIIETKVVNEYGAFTDQRKFTPKDWYNYFVDKIKLTKAKESEDKPEKTLKIPNRLKQLTIFTNRDLATKLSNKQYLVINMLQAPLLALILAFIVRHTSTESDTYIFRENPNIPAYFFMAIIVALFMGLTISAEEIFKDRKILKREKFLNLSRWSYLISKMLILFTISAIQTLLFVLIGDIVLGIKGMTMSFWLVMFSISCFANVLGLNISSAFNSAVTIYITIPLLLIPQLILSGVVVNFDKLHPLLNHESKVPLIGELMASKWGYEALVVTQFKDNIYTRNFYEYEKVSSESEYVNLYLYPAIDTDLSYINSHIKQHGKKDEALINKHLSSVQSELIKEMEANSIPKNKFPEIDDLTIDRYSENTYTATVKFMKIMKIIYNSRANKANDAKNELKKTMSDTDAKEKKLISMRQNHTNEMIEFFLKNTSSKDRIIETDKGFVQKIYPIYMDSEPSSKVDIRSHFYAPKKHFAGLYFDTLYFNVFIIWLMSLILIVSLYFDWFKKIVEVFGK
ncbi:ATP-binding cassette domain-containing protein [Reichenbachiella versicolor]|uniref:ATP-binding cassette domain-containing protein n=1 Tax=Reichenbachiella versicolor TaxID=1821036 RepID=UPI000D6E510A|nr:ATP-binding cassette domain-containing protein [Reichenbachiella versicolor]